MSCAISLIALGVGYMVFLNASKEKGNIRQIGRIIGAVIIVLSILSGIYMAKCKMDTCSMYGKAPMCPITAKSLK